MLIIYWYHVPSGNLNVSIASVTLGADYTMENESADHSMLEDKIDYDQPVLPIKIRVKYSQLSEETEDDLPTLYRHIREPERWVRDEVYWTMPELDGYRFHTLTFHTKSGCNYNNKQYYLVESHKIPVESDDIEKSLFDCNTLPTKDQFDQCSRTWNFTIWSLLTLWKQRMDKQLSHKSDLFVDIRFPLVNWLYYI